MKLLATISDRDFGLPDKLATDEPRIAVRGILLDGRDRAAILYVGKYGMYSIPGGGVDEGETMRSALKREMLEETGCHGAVIAEIGEIRENRAMHNFTQSSSYYLMRLVGEIGEPCLTDSEAEEQVEIQWHILEDALVLFQKEIERDYRQKYFQRRDILAMEAAIEFLKSATRS